MIRSAAFIGSVALAGVMLAAAVPATAGEVVITITDMRSTKGVVRACMTTEETIFPQCRKDPSAHRTVVAAGKAVVIRFTGVEPGDYAVALLHDENNDGKANRALGMMPKEGFGFSRDANVAMAPPKFGDAVFTHTGANQKLTIKMRYIL